MDINGTVENIIFRNDDNGWTVLLISDGKAVFTLVGNITKISAGEHIKADVEEVYNENYGKQYKIKKYEIILPNDCYAIERYLSSKEFKGIGKSVVKRLIEYFGEDTLNVIKNDKEKLFGIKGLTHEKIDMLSDIVTLRDEEIKVILELEKYELTERQITNIVDAYGIKALDIIKENPYKLALKVDGVGFVICDKIAKINGLKSYDSKRIEAALLYILEKEYINGNVYIEKRLLIDELYEILKLDIDYNFDDIFYNLQITLKIVDIKENDKELVFLKKIYNIEKKLSEMLFERKDDITIITGGPGTGKTYNIKKYIKEAEDKGLKVELCAPTGRAAKRITEVTNKEAKTIHRLLECTGTEDGKTYFNKNEENKLDIDVLIVDEMSMVDENLMYHLMKAVPLMCKIILVGDVNQLPSVGAGEVLKDMIKSKIFNVKLLTTIHRQSEGSNIVVNAHKVNEGKIVDFKMECSDFKFIHIADDTKVKDSITKLVNEKIPKFFNIEIDQIQVLCPSKMGVCGTESLNLSLQEKINPSDYTKSELKVRDNVLRIGDKVMQTVNNYCIPYDVKDDAGRILDRGFGIFNGDIGKIIDIDEEMNTLIVKFDDKEAFYEKKALNDLTLAYAITVHKSQGSEYEVVVMPMTTAPNKLLYRKILYTAMTRAKRSICFIGKESIFNAMSTNENITKRNSMLCNKIYFEN